MPPIRPRAGTTLMLSTVANTAFSSATGRRLAVSVSARANGALTANAARTTVTLNPRIVVFAIMNDPTGA